MATDKPDKGGLNRRQVLKSAGVMSASLATPLVSSGVVRGAESSPSASEVGIADTVSSLFKEGKHSEAIHLLEKHGVKHDGSVVRMPSIGSKASDSQERIGTQSEWDKSSSSFAHYSYHLRGNVYSTYATWTLRGGGSWETSGPRDGIGITVNPDMWEPQLESWDWDNRSVRDNRGAKGVIVKFNDPDGPLTAPSSQRTGYLELQLEKTEPGSHNIYGTYVHSWLPFGVPGWISFELAIGPIVATASGGTDKWTKINDNEI